VPDQAGTLERLAAQLAAILAPIAGRLSDGQILGTLAELGVQFPQALVTDPTITPARKQIISSAEQLGPLVADLAAAIEAQQVTQIVAAGVAVTDQCTRLIASLSALATALQTAGPALPGISAAQVTELVTDLPRKLLDLLLLNVLDLSSVAGAVATVFGVVERDYNPGDPNDPTKPPYEQVTVHLERLPTALTNPVQQLADLYQWGQPGFDPMALFTAMEAALAFLGYPVLLQPPSGGNPPILQAFAVDLQPAAPGPGLQLDIVMPASLNQTFTFPVSPPTWTANVQAQAAIQIGLTGQIRPPLDITLTPPSGSFAVSVTVDLQAQPPEPFVVLGEAGSTRLEFSTLDFGGGITFAVDSTGSATAAPSADGGITGGHLVIDASQGDGFLTTLLGGGTIDSQFDLGFTLAADTGLRFHGSGALEIQLPVHITLGPVDIQSVYLVVQLANGSVPIELSAGFSAALGPLQASVDRMGAIATLSLPPGGGNLGPANIAFAFKPPNGVGLAVDAGVVSGGGFLYIDNARGEYAGAVQLEFADFLSLGAIGLIDTKLPDGSSGFSLLIIITADFGAGLQLGFGFTLNAVGGLLGVNRAMLFQPLMDGVRTGAIDSVMFPQNIVANAPKIISDLRAIFPPQQGTFLIGPMAKLGWGEPTLVSLSLGVIVEIPPGDIAILGVLELALPAEDLAILVLQVNFAGALEFDKQRMYFFASLYDSHILFITIEGEMGLLFAWGSNANFVVTVGGFHPQYNPPPLPFPSPQRISVDIINESYARIHADGYFAVTTNTVQFGTHSEYFFGFSAVSVTGSSGFDALIQFSPFHFSVSVSTSFSANVFGVGVFSVGIDLTLDGPEPWHAHGTASLSFLFFSVGIGIDFTWGDSGNTTLAPVAVMPILTAEFGKQSNWRAMPPAGSNILVSLRALSPADAQLVLHPVGTLQVSQRAIPIDLTLDTVGNQKPDDANRFSLSVASPDLVQTATLTEPFALAQFKALDDATKLSQPAYVPQDSGIEMSAAGNEYGSGTAVVRIVRDDVTIIDTKLRRSSSKFTYSPGTLFRHGLKGNAAARSTLSGTREQQTHPFDGSVQVSAETFAVARQSDNTVYQPGAATFTSPASARDYIDRAVAADPTLAGTLHVLPHFEVAP
jgi:hypothetical protein